MKRLWLRSSVFNILFVLWTLVLAIFYLPSIVLPRRAYLGLVRFYLRGIYVLERLILGLSYEIRGAENLPSDGSYIVAAKHQSAYETLKLHLLFHDPAVILKKELLSIPLWGMYLKKADVIAIDRSSPDAAIQSIQSGAKRMMAQGRPIIIFPQGTRVRADQSSGEKPYKVGVARIQEATDLPIIPMATNTGMFWAKGAWGKSKGRVVFEFLPPIKAGMNRGDLLKTLDTQVEGKTQTLMDEALHKNQHRSRFVPKTIIALCLCFFAYAALWFGTAFVIKREYNKPRDLGGAIERFSSTPRITGFPGLMRLYIPEERFRAPQGQVVITDIRITGWPIILPFLDVDIASGPVVLHDAAWPEALSFSKTRGRINIRPRTTHIKNAFAKYGVTKIRFKGSVSPADPIDLDGVLAVQNHSAMLRSFEDKGFISQSSLPFIAAGLNLFRDEAGLSIPLSTKDDALYAGGFAVYRFAPSHSAPPQSRSRAVPSPLAP